MRSQDRATGLGITYLAEAERGQLSALDVHRALLGSSCHAAMMPCAPMPERVCRREERNFGRKDLSCVRLGARVRSPGHKEQPMDGVLKKGVGLLVLLFLGVWLVQDPNGFATTAKEAGTAIWDLLMTLFDSIMTFVQSLTS